MAHSITRDDSRHTAPQFVPVPRLLGVPDAGLCYNVRSVPTCLGLLCTLDCDDCESADSPASLHSCMTDLRASEASEASSISAGRSFVSLFKGGAI